MTTLSVLAQSEGRNSLPLNPKRIGAWPIERWIFCNSNFSNGLAARPACMAGSFCQAQGGLHLRATGRFLGACSAHNGSYTFSGARCKARRCAREIAADDVAHRIVF